MAELVISQVKTRGMNGGSDEFVEIYNPGNVAVTFDATWTLQDQSAATGCGTGYATRFTGAGQVIPPHGHILYVNDAMNDAGALLYSEVTPPDGTYPSNFGITDSGGIVLARGGTQIDALCFYYDATTLATLTSTSCTHPYACLGTPVLNAHDNTTKTDTNASLERKPGGSSGNTQNTGDNATDFAAIPAADPHDLASPPVP